MSQLVLLTVTGTPNAKTLDAARTMHNQTAGSPEGVAAARSLGDLSHLVYAPADDGKLEIVFMDIWRDLAGMGQFFGSEQVQQGGAKLFAARDPVTWQAADGFVTFHIPPSKPTADRFVGLVRGTVKSVDAARRIFNEAPLPRVVRARELGQMSHEVFLRANPPGQPASLELLGVDTWMTLDGMAQFYREPGFMEALSPAFSAAPATWTLKPAPGAWVQW
jgi:hypothetical protein